MNTVKKWLMANAEAIPDALIIGIGIIALIVVIWQDVSGGSGTETARGATLMLLTLLGASLLLDRKTSSRLEQTTQDIIQTNKTTNDQLNQTITKILQANAETQSQVVEKTEAILQRLRQRRISDILIPFGAEINERARRLGQAKEIWILSRTCRRLWSDYEDELKSAAKQSGLRLLFIDPKSSALDMIAKSAIMSLPDDAGKTKSSVEDFIVRLGCTKQREDLRGLEFGLIDYLPAWTLIFINPSEKHRSNGGMVYVELATFRSHPRNRPSFTVEYGSEADLFERFCGEFEQMWETAQKPTA